MTPKKNTITGIYNPVASGDFGFVDIEGEDKGYYVYPTNKKDALPGDKVLAETKVFKGKLEAKIIKVLERSDSIFIGEFKAGKESTKNTKTKQNRKFSYGFVIINNQNFKNDVFIPGKFFGSVKDGDIVGVKITGWKSKSPEGKIVEVLGKKGDKGLEIDSFILEAGFKQSFSHENKNELNKLTEKISNDEVKKRVDHRNLLTFTIDGEDSKDLDDAISIIERKNGNFELYVHIADVAHYVREGTILDKEALKRGTSVYLTDRVLPMLPTKLSNNLCSLNPDTDKLTLTCEMLFGKDGQIKKQKVYESIIRSDFRLTYREVDDIIAGDVKKGSKLCFGGKISKEIIECLKKSNFLKELIEKKKYGNVLNFNFPETKIELDKDRNPIKIKEYPRYKSNKIIEEFMISANESVSRDFLDYPFLHRIHPEPREEDISKLQNTLNLFDIDFQIKKASTKEFFNLLELIEKNPKKTVLENIILRTLSKAIYSHERQGHFGLGLDYYSHFTSPIRRYPDLQIHRIIKDRISKKLDKKRISHYESILKNIANHTSTQESKAEKLEYKVRDFYITKYYKPKVGELFDANIVSVISKGIFVQLKDTAEGFVDFSNSLSMYYREEFFQFEDRGSGNIYKLGDKIKVKLVEVDEKMLRLNFEIVE